MAGTLFAVAFRAVDANGAPYSGAKWKFYQSGGSTPANVYADSALGSSLGATVTADSGGLFASIYLDSSITYRAVLENSTGSVTVRDIDPVNDQIRKDLASSGGSSLVGFSQAGSGAVLRTAQAKMRDQVSPEDFGAVGDGATDDKAALLFAMGSGRLVNGNGRTYAIDGTLKISRFYNFIGLVNINLVQLSQDEAGSDGSDFATLWIEDHDNFVLRDIAIDRGSSVQTPNWGAEVNSGLNHVFGLIVRDNNTTPKGFTIDNVRVTGDGPGTGIYVKDCEHYTVKNCTVHDMDARRGDTNPTDDIIQGMAFAGNNFTIDNCHVRNLEVYYDAQYQNILSRGIVIGDATFFKVTNCTVYGCDQNFDFTGSAEISDFIMSHCYSERGGAWGFKFSNITKRGKVIGCTAVKCGWAGFVWMQSNDTASNFCRDIDAIGCTAIDTGFVTSRTVPNPYGFYIWGNNASYLYAPFGIRLIDCRVHDEQSPQLTDVAFYSSASPTRQPTAGFDENRANQLVNCTADNGITFSSGLGPNVCVVAGNTTQSIANATWEELDFNVNTSDNGGLHSTSTNNDTVVIKTPGTYRVTVRAAFIANATGYRMARVLMNGNAIDLSQGSAAAFAGQECTVEASCIVDCATADTLKGQVFQNSGGALNVNLERSSLSAVRIGG